MFHIFYICIMFIILAENHCYPFNSLYAIKSSLKCILKIIVWYRTEWVKRSTGNISQSLLATVFISIQNSIYFHRECFSPRNWTEIQFLMCHWFPFTNLLSSVWHISCQKLVFPLQINRIIFRQYLHYMDFFLLSVPKNSHHLIFAVSHKSRFGVFKL